MFLPPPLSGTLSLSSRLGWSLWRKATTEAGGICPFPSSSSPCSSPSANGIPCPPFSLRNFVIPPQIAYPSSLLFLPRKKPRKYREAAPRRDEGGEGSHHAGCIFVPLFTASAAMPARARRRRSLEQTSAFPCMRLCRHTFPSTAAAAVLP